MSLANGWNNGQYSQHPATMAGIARLPAVIAATTVRKSVCGDQTARIPLCFALKVVSTNS